MTVQGFDRNTIQGQVYDWDNLDIDWKQRISQGVFDIPHTLICPETQAELAQVMTIAHQNHYRVIPCGQGTKLSWLGIVKKSDWIISLRNIKRMVDYAIEDLTVTAEAGMKLSELQSILSQHNQFLPIDPSYPQNATLGGIVATGDTGSLRCRYGGVRDLLLGLSAVRSNGDLTKAGGRVVKNVAGYDLMKLFTGSYGTLGIITQVTFRVYPLPESSQSILITGNYDAINHLRKAIVLSSLTPTCADLLSKTVLKSLEIEDDLGILIQIRSIPASIQEQIKQIQNLAQSLGLKYFCYQQDLEDNLWSEINQFKNNPHQKITCKIGILPSETVSLLKKFSDHPIDATIHIHNGLGKISLPENTSLKLITEIREFCQTHQGFLSILEANINLKQQIDVWGYQTDSLSLMQTLKKRFDPDFLLNNARIF